MPLATHGFDFGCMKHLFQFQPCSLQVFNMKFLGFPISNTCCNKILQFANTGCPPPLPYGLFMQSKNSCVQNSTPLPSQPPPLFRPPSPPSRPVPPSPPQPHCNPSTNVPQNYTGKYCNLESCITEMIDFYGKVCPVISKPCCEFISKVVENCPDQDGKLTQRSYEYCKNLKN
uniref:Prolamin-like domain-containing protein n=1 Tax=Cannabis sativa TaxID=3483 RepID=A0A803QMN0_CANSA